MKFCLIGERLGHSYSETLHRLRGLEYTLRELSKEELPAFFEARDFDGYNVTVPYKKDVLRFLDERSPLVEELGAVNTIVNRGGVLCGENTDYVGMEYALRRANIALEGRQVLILGSGGAAATAFLLAKKHRAARVGIVSRTGKLHYGNCRTCFPNAEIIVNATPVGMYPNVSASPMSLAAFTKLVGVFDCVYNPEETAFLKEARSLGINCEGGLSMLAEQALAAEDFWLNTTHTDRETEEIIKKLQGTERKT